MSDNFAFIIGAVGAVMIAQIGNELNFADIVNGLTANGVLALTFYWVMRRFEARLDDAFKSHKELSEQLIELLKEAKK